MNPKICARRFFIIVPTLGALQDQPMLPKEDIPGHSLPRTDEGICMTLQ